MACLSFWLMTILCKPTFSDASTTLQHRRQAWSVSICDIYKLTELTIPCGLSFPLLVKLEENQGHRCFACSSSSQLSFRYYNLQKLGMRGERQIRLRFIKPEQMRGTEQKSIFKMYSFFKLQHTTQQRSCNTCITIMILLLRIRQASLSSKLVLAMSL